MQTGITVRCAIPRIHNGKLQWLMVLRLPNERYFANHLEFPGGEAKRVGRLLLPEDPKVTLIRELGEEVGIRPIDPRWVDTNEGAGVHGTPSGTWQMLFSTMEFEGAPVANRSQVARVLWVDNDTLLERKITRLTRHWRRTLPFFNEHAQRAVA